MTVEVKRSVTHAQWIAEGRSLFGDDPLKWAFVCPSCGYVATVQDWVNEGESIDSGKIAYSCVGRLRGTATEIFPSGPGPCNYAGGGLFQLNPVEVEYPNGNKVGMFEFAASEVI